MRAGDRLARGVAECADVRAQGSELRGAQYVLVQVYACHRRDDAGCARARQAGASVSGCSVSAQPSSGLLIVVARWWWWCLEF